MKKEKTTSSTKGPLSRKLRRVRGRLPLPRHEVDFAKVFFIFFIEKGRQGGGEKPNLNYF